MNWKMNSWTVLFVFVVVVWQVSCDRSGKETPQLSPAELARLENDAIPPDDARARIAAFEQYAEVFYFFSQRAGIATPVIPPASIVTDAIQSSKIINPDVKFFKIPKDDILALAKYAPLDTIYAVLSLKDTTINKEPKTEIDLLFYVQSKKASDHTGDGGTFYDFTEPCPNSCPNPPPPPFN